MDWKVFLALGGWLLAISQFVFTFRETRHKNESELLEKTLGYFERGTQARSIAVSLVEGIWLKRNKNLDIVLPVLVSQAHFLLTDADDYAQERRNLVRILTLIEKIMPLITDNGFEKAEICEAIIDGVNSSKGVDLSKTSLRIWYKKFNNGCSDDFDQHT